jgi:large subunit ribosomal protein L17
VRHQRSGKKLGRDSAHRKALYSNLTGALIEHGRIKTTATKAKAVKPIAEQMITLGRRGDLHARRQATAFLRSRDVVHKLFAEVAPQFAERPGGYTRIVKIGHRYGDAAEMVYLELVTDTLVFKTRLPRETADEIAAAPAPEADATDETEVDAEADDAEPEAEAEDAVADDDAEAVDAESEAEEAAAEAEDAEADDAEAADESDDAESEPQK